MFAENYRTVHYKECILLCVNYTSIKLTGEKKTTTCGLDTMLQEGLGGAVPGVRDMGSTARRIENGD